MEWKKAFLSNLLISLTLRLTLMKENIPVHTPSAMRDEEISKPRYLYLNMRMVVWKLYVYL